MVQKAFRKSHNYKIMEDNAKKKKLISLYL